MPVCPADSAPGIFLSPDPVADMRMPVEMNAFRPGQGEQPVHQGMLAVAAGKAVMPAGNDRFRLLCHLFPERPGVRIRIGVLILAPGNAGMRYAPFVLRGDVITKEVDRIFPDLRAEPEVFARRCGIVGC